MDNSKHSPEAVVSSVVLQARDAQRLARSFSQREVDDVVKATAWACYREGNARALANMSVKETGMGNEADRVDKIRRKALMILRDLQGAPSVGIINKDRDRKITEVAKPVGVVGVFCPSTHPATDLMAKALLVLKGRNTIVVSPSPRSAGTARLTVHFIWEELERIGAPANLVQILPEASKPLSNELMVQCDMIAVTGSANNVRAAYRSGTPTVAGGAGNVPVIVEASANLSVAAECIRRSKTFDYGSACSAESAILVEESVYSEIISLLEHEGGILLSETDKTKLGSSLWPEGRLAVELVAASPQAIANAAHLGMPPSEHSFFMVEEEDVGHGAPFSGEKLSPVVAIYRYREFSEALDLADRILSYEGAGHSCGIHTGEIGHALALGERMNVARVIVNQPQALAEAGSFSNGLPATMILGCGTWGGNGVGGNVTYRDFINITRIAEPLPESVPTEAEVWGDYFDRFGLELGRGTTASAPVQIAGAAPTVGVVGDVG